MPRNTRLSTASRSLTDTFRNTLLATCAGLAFMAPALADTEGDPVDDGPIARGTPPEGGTIVYTTWQPERRIWMEFYWVVPEGYGDAHGVCLSQSYSTFSSAEPEARGSLRNQPLSFCNRNEYGELEPGRAPWDRANRRSAETEQTGSRFMLDDRRDGGDLHPACLLPWNWFKCVADSDAASAGGGAGAGTAAGSPLAFARDMPVAPHIIAGDDSTIDGIVDTENQFSNVVLITVETTTGSSVCTGTLINRRQVLAAAHCFAGGDVTRVEVSFDPEGQTGYFGAMSVTVHESYDPDTFGADVAVITLDTASLAADPVTLEGSDGANTMAGSRIVLAGYGSFGTGETGQLSIDGRRRHGVNTLDLIGTWGDFFNETGEPLPPILSGEPGNFLFVDFDGPGGINLLGGGAIDGEASSAQGDSGGPLFADSANGLIQIGIVSNGNSPYGPLGGYGTWVAYIPVAEYIDWIEGLDPFIERHALAGDGYWHDAAHWEYGDIPENDRGEPGTTVVTDAYIVPEIYEVYLDAPGITRVAQDEYVDAVYVFDGATLIVEDGGQLALDTGIGMTGGEIRIEGDVIGQALELHGGLFDIAETGSYSDFSPYYSGGMNLTGAAVRIAGELATDWLHQTGGSLWVTETGVFFDYLGTMVEGGSIGIDGIFDTASFNQFGGYTSIFSNGVLYDASGSTFIADSELYVGGILDTLELLIADSTVMGDGIIYAPFGVYQLGGTLLPGYSLDEETPGGSLIIEGDYLADDVLFVVSTDGTATDYLHVLGSANIAGEVSLFQRGNAPLARNSRFTFLEAEGGLTVGDLTVADPQISPMLSLSLGQTANSAYLQVDARAYAEFAQTDQQRALATALDAAAGDDVPSGDFADLVNTLDYMPGEDALRTALQTANPGDTFAMDRMGEGLSRAMGDVIAGRMALFAEGRHGGGMDMAGTGGSAIQLASSNAGSVEVLTALQAATRAASSGQMDRINDRTGVYVSVEGGWGETDLPNGTTDLESHHIVAGVDFEPAGNWLIGANAGFSDYSAHSATTHVQGESVSLAAYAGYAGSWLYGSAYIGASRLDYDLTRSILLGVAEMRATASTDANQFDAGFDIGADLIEGNAVFGPVLRLRHGNTDIDGYSETGAGVFNATLAARENDRTLLGAGGRFASGGKTRFFGQLTWEQDISEGDGQTRASLAGAPSAGFAVLDGHHDDSFASLALGIDIDASDRVAISARARSDFGRDTDEDTALSLAINWRF